MNEKLKPCPFCGGEQINVNLPATNFGSVELICISCPAIVRFGGSFQLGSATEAWNRRYDERKDCESNENQ